MSVLLVPVVEAMALMRARFCALVGRMALSPSGWLGASMIVLFVAGMESSIMRAAHSRPMQAPRAMLWRAVQSFSIMVDRDAMWLSLACGDALLYDPLQNFEALGLIGLIAFKS